MGGGVTNGKAITPKFAQNMALVVTTPRQLFLAVPVTDFTIDLVLIVATFGVILVSRNDFTLKTDP